MNILHQMTPVAYLPCEKCSISTRTISGLKKPSHDTFYSKDEWHANKDTSKSIKNAFYILEYKKAPLGPKTVSKECSSKAIAVVKYASLKVSI